MHAVAVQPDGKILIGGSFGTYNGAAAVGVTRLNADGALDTTFNPGGAGADGQVVAVAVQPDGKILIGGFFTTYNGVTAYRVARLNADGTRDTTFNAGYVAPSTNANALAVQPDGKILVGGYFGPGPTKLTRLNADGTRDATFNPGGAGPNSVGTGALGPARREDPRRRDVHHLQRRDRGRRGPADRRRHPGHHVQPRRRGGGPLGRFGRGPA